MLYKHRNKYFFQTRDNAVYVSMVESVLKTGYFYFSTTYDITHTLQRLHNTSPEFVSIPLHERVSLPLYTIHDIKYFQHIYMCQ